MPRVIPKILRRYVSPYFSNSVTIKKGLSKGANDYITKPVNKNELLARIRLHISMCLSCKVVCEKNHQHTPQNLNTPDTDNFVEINICESCKRAPSYSGQKSLLLAPRGSKMQLLRNIAEEPGSILDIANNLPLLVTLYDVDGSVVVRNKEAAYVFSITPQSTAFQNNTFLVHIQDRSMANSILSRVLAGINSI